jgi:Uncharacterized protein conserved in bacteria
MAKSARGKAAKPLAELIDNCLGPALSAQGFATSDVLMAWADIVGRKLAAFTQPIKLEWPRRRSWDDMDSRPAPASLVVRVESAFALELQHQAPVVIEKINAYYGWQCVGKLVLKQGPVRKPEKKPPQSQPLSDQEKDRISDAVLPIDDDALRDALRGLGENVLSSKKQG